MARQWPAFITRDLDDSDADMLEMERRWRVYRDEMNALIAAGDVHLDEDGWWIDDATSDLIGPDPEIERPLTLAEAPFARTLDDVTPELADALRSGRGLQRAPTKVSTTLRLDPDILAHYRATGTDWQLRINEALRRAANL